MPYQYDMIDMEGAYQHYEDGGTTVDFDYPGVYADRMMDILGIPSEFQGEVLEAFSDATDTSEHHILCKFADRWLCHHYDDWMKKEGGRK